MTSSDEKRQARWRDWCARRAFPFVPEASAAVVVDVEEDGCGFWRRMELVRAGLIGGLLPGGAWACGDVERARARRAAEPRPDVVLLCRHQGDAGRAIREVERETGLPRVPVIVVGSPTVEELLECGRAVDADAVLRMSACESGLVEVVVRLGWPKAYADACPLMGIDASTRDWPEGTAPVTPPRT